MEWLRDNDGIYPVVPVEEMNKIFPDTDHSGSVSIRLGEHTYTSYDKDDIKKLKIKISSNIEDFFDCYLYLNKNNTFYQIGDNPNIKIKRKNISCYGAIILNGDNNMPEIKAIKLIKEVR